MNRKISIIGLGYVGLPVAVAFGKKRTVIGFDINENRLSELRKGKDSTREIEPEELKCANIFYTSNIDDLREADFHIIAVPTPIDEAKHPDLGPLLSATETGGKILKPGDIVVYESTVYPGCTEEECAPILERLSGLKYIHENSHQLEDDFESTHKGEGESTQGFYLGYSPERINPGDREHSFTTIKKVVSGSTKEISDIICEVYNSVVTAGVYRASSIKVAEAAKVIENTQRDLNIALINELALIFDRIDIDTHEVLEAAGTKWNFIKFRPGLVGGHCIGVDPYYLTYCAERLGYHPQVILAGRCINDSMGTFVAQRTVKTMASAGIGSVGAKVIVLGLTFKENCPDLRNSKFPEIVAELQRYGCKVHAHDPCCDQEEAFNEFGLILCSENEMHTASGVVLAVAHQHYRNWTLVEWQRLLEPKGIVADVTNVAPAIELENAGHLVWKL